MLRDNSIRIFLVTTVFVLSQSLASQEADHIADLQSRAVQTKQADWGRWGPSPDTYSSWTSHTNRLVPVYTFGINLSTVRGKNSVYRDAQALKKLYGYEPTRTLNPKADYFDQTDVYRLQKAAIDSGKKRVILMVFDGLDWDTTRAAAIANLGKVTYHSGRGNGLSFLDYRGADRDFGDMVTSPYSDGTTVDVDRQTVTGSPRVRGGYDPSLCGTESWTPISNSQYPISKHKSSHHAYTDSAASATAMTCGIKTYNAAINIDPLGRKAFPLARRLQENGFAIGVVTNVPISHATPACSYANNVHRNEYQDLTRDLIGRPSVSHPGGLSGVDVLLGAGWGVEKEKDAEQGKNFVPGNRYLTEEDEKAVDVIHGGKYVVAARKEGVAGAKILADAAHKAKKNNHRLLGFFGTKYGHLPYRTADGNYNPVSSIGNNNSAKPEVYSNADIKENPTLEQMAIAAVEVLNSRSDRWWLMVEAGDVDWACHANNIDNAIGSVISGDKAFHAITSWIEKNGGWKETALILTADHGHYLILNKPEALIPSTPTLQNQSK